MGQLSGARGPQPSLPCPLYYCSPPLLPGAQHWWGAAQRIPWLILQGKAARAPGALGQHPQAQGGSVGSGVGLEDPCGSFPAQDIPGLCGLAGGDEEKGVADLAAGAAAALGSAQ